MSRKAGSISIREKKRRRAGYSLIAPACLVLLVIFFVPLIYAFAISISDSDAIINNSFRFVGLKNYFSVMTNSKFLAALGHTCFFVITTITLEFIIGFVVALLLYREVAGSRVFRLIFAVPLMVAPVVSGLQWRWLFADQYGIINALLNKLGFEAPLWFTQVSTSWVTIIVANLWLATPFVILVLLAGLGGLSEELNEASSIDGANEIQHFFKIMIPVCKPIIAVLALWSFVGMWNSYFDALIYLNDADLQPLQLVLRSILVQNTPQPGMIADIQSTAEMAKVAEQLKYATIVVSSLPLLIMYPFFQKYFDKGIMVGSVKG